MTIGREKKTRKTSIERKRTNAVSKKSRKAPTREKNLFWEIWQFIKDFQKKCKKKVLEIWSQKKSGKKKVDKIKTKVKGVLEKM